MKSIDDLNNLPESLKREVLDYAELLMKNYEVSQNRPTGKKWADISGRGKSKGITITETLLRERYGDPQQKSKKIESLLSFAEKISQKVKKLLFLHATSVIVVSLSFTKDY